MRFGSVCSGIEAASVAWESLGWEAAWFAEIDEFPSAVLAHHFPDVLNVGDMTTLVYLIKNRIVEAPDVLVGGTPCQAFSVAGKRNSLDDDRGQLSLEYCRILDAIDEINDDKCIAVWENVPGVLNTKDNAFGCFLAELSGAKQELKPSGRWTNAGCVFGPKRTVAWRILDAQYFGVAQRRRRVFVIASAREGFNPAEILLEFDGVRRDIAPSRETRKNTSEGAGRGFASSSFAQYRPVIGDGATLKASGGDLGGGSENLVAYGCSPVRLDSCKVGTITRSYGCGGADLETKPLILENEGFRMRGFGVNADVSPTLTKSDRPAVAATLTTGFGARGVDSDQICNGNFSIDGGRVRRLMPIECERLQGFPDSWTKIPYRNKECPDGPRYSACGNSMAVPVMKWIGFRIDKYVSKKYTRG